MLNQLTAFVFLLSFALQTFSKALIVVGYFADNSVYAQHCENKAKPKMRCAGKCQMMKKLHSEEKKDDQYPQRRAENKDETTLSSKSFFCILSIPEKKLPPAIYVEPAAGKEIKIPRSVFHPPSA